MAAPPAQVGGAPALRSAVRTASRRRSPSPLCPMSRRPPARGRCRSSARVGFVLLAGVGGGQLTWAGRPRTPSPGRGVTASRLLFCWSVHSRQSSSASTKRASPCAVLRAAARLGAEHLDGEVVGLVHPLLAGASAGGGGDPEPGDLGARGQLSSSTSRVRFPDRVAVAMSRMWFSFSSVLTWFFVPTRGAGARVAVRAAGGRPAGAAPRAREDPDARPGGVGPSGPVLSGDARWTPLRSTLSPDVPLRGRPERDHRDVVEQQPWSRSQPVDPKLESRITVGLVSPPVIPVQVTE